MGYWCHGQLWQPPQYATREGPPLAPRRRVASLGHGGGELPCRGEREKPSSLQRLLVPCRGNGSLGWMRLLVREAEQQRCWARPSSCHASTRKQEGDVVRI